MEGETKITTVEKVKDPRRVAQGKRLAAISREAKERKARERQEQQQESETSSYLMFVPVIVIGAVAFGGIVIGLKITLRKKKNPSLSRKITCTEYQD